MVKRSLDFSECCYEDPPLATSLMYRGVSTYDELKRSTKAYKTGTRALKSNATSTRDDAIEWLNKHKINETTL